MDKKSRKKVGLGYILLFVALFFELFVVDPIDLAVNGWGSGFGNWFFEIILNIMAVWFLVFLVALPLAISYLTGRKGTDKRDLFLGIFAFIFIMYAARSFIMGVFGSVEAASRGGVNAYDWAGFVTGLIYLAMIITVFVACDFIPLFKAGIKTAMSYFPKDATVEDVKQEETEAEILQIESQGFLQIEAETQETTPDNIEEVETEVVKAVESDEE